MASEEAAAAFVAAGITLPTTPAFDINVILAGQAKVHHNSPACLTTHICSWKGIGEGVQFSPPAGIPKIMTNIFYIYED